MRKFGNTKLSGSRFRIGAIALVVLVIVCITTLFVQVAPKKAKAAADSALYFNPANYSVGLNQDFALDAMINPGSNQVNGVSLQITFDPAKFRLDNIDNAGSPFTDILHAVGQPNFVIDNNAGTAAIDLGVHPGASSVTSLSKVATLSFHSLTKTTDSLIAFSNSAYAVATGESGDVLKTRTPATVTVNAKTYTNADFANLAADWLQAVPGSLADVNSDGVVNTRDMGIMMSNWGG